MSKTKRTNFKMMNLKDLDNNFTLYLDRFEHIKETHNVWQIRLNDEISSGIEFSTGNYNRAQRRRNARQLEENRHLAAKGIKHMEEIEDALCKAKQAKEKLEQIPLIERDMPIHVDARMEYFEALDTLHIRLMRYNNDIETHLGGEVLYFLNQTIDKLLLPENREKYFVNPEADFTRNRKCPLKDVIYLLTGSGRQSLNKEIFSFYRSDDVITASGFDQQRSKLKPEGIQFIFDEFSRKVSWVQKGTVKGYRIIGTDGTDLNVLFNPSQDTYMECSNGEQGYNQYHVVTFQDVLTRTYLDVEIQPKPSCNETGAATTMVKRRFLSVKEKAILTRDRGFASFNLLETCNRNGIDYCLRIKENFCRESTDMPPAECDQDFETIIFTRQTKENKELFRLKKARYLSGKSPFGKYKNSQTWEYEDGCVLKFRIVRFSLGVKDGKEIWETLITSLPREEFSIDDLRQIYHLRWDAVEGGYRNLKYDLGLSFFHGKLDQYYRQEIYAKLLGFNFGQTLMNYAEFGCDAFNLEYDLTAGNQNIQCKKNDNAENADTIAPEHINDDQTPFETNKKSKISHYQLNRTMGFSIAMDFLMHGGDVPYHVFDLMRRFLLPVRYNRRFPLKLRSIPFVGYCYR